MNQIISESAVIGKDTKIGFNVIIMDNANIGQGCQIGHNVIIYEGTKIGNFVRIDDNSIIGKKPMTSPRSIFKAENNLKPAEIGDNCLIGANVTIYAQCKLGEKNLVADLATVRENVTVGNFNIIGRGVAIENYCTIGNKNKFETNAYITAYSTVEDYCFVAPCVATSNDNYMARDKERFNHFKGVTLKTGARIGVNSTILPGKIIAEDGTVAAGSVVSRDIPKEELWLGSPAKKFKNVEGKQLLVNNKD